MFFKLTSTNNFHRFATSPPPPPPPPPLPPPPSPPPPPQDAEELDTWFSEEKDKLSPESSDLIRKLLARKKMQDKYIGDCFELYGDLFHIVLQPLLDYEVRGVERLKEFSETLINPVED